MPFDLQPTLRGELVHLRPMRASDWDALYAAASDPLIWEVHPAHDRWQEPVFKQFFDEGMASGGALVALDARDDRVIGTSRYTRYDESISRIEIGWTFLTRAYWGGEYNREMKRLMLDHAFRFVRTVTFHAGVTNWRSQRALEKIGAVCDGVEMHVDGRESVAFHIHRRDWIS